MSQKSEIKEDIIANLHPLFEWLKVTGREISKKIQFPED